MLACSGYSVTGGPGPVYKQPFQASVQPNFKPLKLNVVAVLPLQQQSTGPTNSFSSTSEQLTQSLLASLNLNTELHLLNHTSQQVVNDSIETVLRASGSMRNKAKKLGESVEAQAVLYGLYQAGGSGRAEENTSASFSLWLLDLDQDEVVWTGTYEKRNRPLSDNLFGSKYALKKGIRYRSAPELFKEGFDYAAKSLQSYRRENS